MSLCLNSKTWSRNRHAIQYTLFNFLHPFLWVSGEFGTKWIRDQVNSGPSGEFGTRWIRDQTLGEFGTKFFQSHKYVNTGISYLVWVPFPTYFIAPLWYAIMHLCVEFVFVLLFLPMIECALSFKIPCIYTYHARYALVFTSFTNILWTYAVQRVGMCITISVHTIIKNNTTGFKSMFIGLNKQSKVTTCN